MNREPKIKSAKRYLLAAGTVGAAFLLSLLIVRLVPRTDVSAIFLAAVLLAAWRGGLAAGLAAAALSVFFTAFYFLPPEYPLFGTAQGLLELAVFLLAAILVSYLSDNREKALVREQDARLDAERANRVKDEFLAAVSHELRTPLTTIKTLTRLLLRKNPPETERREYLEDIAAECDRQIDLVHNLLDASRIETGGLQIKLGRVDAAAVVRACEKIFRVEAAEHRHELRTEIAPDLPPIRADHSALRRALSALIENSIKYTPDGGRIRLSARRESDSQVLIAVEDNGRGIHADDLPRVFEGFFRGRAATYGDGNDDEENADAPEEAEVPGIGLGLHLARVLIEGMNGSITAESRLGSGSRFCVRLPVWSEAFDAPANLNQAEFIDISSRFMSGRKI
jgi:signal transduction histidine kinase